MPLPLTDAVTCALPGKFALMAPIRSATVSVPVDVYVVVLVPSLTVTVPLAGIPSVNSDVLAVSGTVPVPLAAAGEELEFAAPEELAEDEEEEPVEPLDDDDDEAPDSDCSALWTAADSALLTRFKAVWLAMLDRPFDKVVMAAPIDEISASSADDTWLWACA